jgi:ABC-type polysaccharide/polyol phosphate transport system ATPase subunit
LFGGGTTTQLAKNEFWALKDISFQVGKGEAFGLIGPNGAGKSTMLKLLCGVMKPTQGRMKLKGTMSALIEVGAGFHPDLTGRENIFLNGTILGMKREQIKNRLDEIIEFSGLGDFIDTPVKRYSSGMYARLGFSVAAHVDPDILIVDEVLSVGDYSFQMKCAERMQTIIHNGSTVVFVSHNLRAVSDLCKRAVLLSRGTILEEGPTNEVIGHYMDALDRESDGGDKDVWISKVNIRKERVDDFQYESGEKAFLEVEIAARTASDGLSIWVSVTDDNYYRLFYTSSTMLGNSSISLEKDETRRCTFQLSVHLAPGTYHVGVLLVQDQSGKWLDSRRQAATIHVKSDSTFGGFVNLCPKAVIE